MVRSAGHDVVGLDTYLSEDCTFGDVMPDISTLPTDLRRQGDLDEFIESHEWTVRYIATQYPTKPLTLDDVLALVKSDWRNQGRKSALTLSDGKTEQSGIRRLRERFGAVEIATITALQLERDSNERQDKGAAVSTVRNELNGARAKSKGRAGHAPRREPWAA
jgi:hypothetical protein